MDLVPLYIIYVTVLASSQTVSFFFFNDTATTEIYTLSLHDALPISNFAALANTNVSYFIGIDTREYRSGMLLVGDRNLEGGRPNENCPVAQVTGVAVAYKIGRAHV